MKGVSTLTLGSLFPLPKKLVSAFVGRMDKVLIDEGPHPAIEMQMGPHEKVKGLLRPGEFFPSPRKAKGPVKGRPDKVFGLTVVRDDLGPASSVNMAHGIVSSGAGGNILAITDERSFLHSGLPAFVNTLYNGSAYVLLIKTEKKESHEDLRAALGGFGFSRCFAIDKAEEIREYAEKGPLTVLFYEGTDL